MINLREQTLTRGDALGLAAIAIRVFDNSADDDVINQAERSIIARLLLPVWRSIGERQRAEVRDVLAADETTFEHILIEAETRAWLATQSELTVGDLLDRLDGGADQ